jgi:NADPH:quinone reductase-like Zn-dependent oxidoreductase
MQAAVVSALGQTPKYTSFPDPTPREGEALIQVRAAGLHPIVKALASGSHYASGGELPMVPGLDGVGVLEDGRRVFFVFVRRPWGTMAEQAAAPLAKCIPLPAGLDDVQAAAIVNPGMSAWLSLKERAGLKPGETVLILGATGVAGQLAIQSARLLGAKRIIVAGRNVHAVAAADVDAVVALGEPEDAVREAFASTICGAGRQSYCWRRSPRDSKPVPHSVPGGWKWARARAKPSAFPAQRCAVLT